MAIITLTTDFGTSDSYVGTIKGVILSIAPETTLVDITHDIAPQAIRQAAYVLHAAAPYYPPGTIHLAVVDPGVGSSRRAIAIQTTRAVLVGPDNGLFTPFLLEDPAAEIHAITQSRYMMPRVSATFHGRDVFAPVAAYLSRSVQVTDLGPRISDPVQFPIPIPLHQPDGSWRASVLYADHFGNLVTSMTEDRLRQLTDEGVRPVVITIGQQRILGVRRTYAEAGPGEIIALVGSSGRLEIAMPGGSAAQKLGLGPDAPVVIRAR